jgi:nucleoside-diphosphate-sugar epimerase
MGPDFVKEAGLLGHTCVCFNRKGTHPASGRGVAGNRDDPAALRTAILETAPDCVVDMIPFREEHAIALGEIIREIKVPLLAASSACVYKAYNILHRVEPPPYQPGPIRENDELASFVTEAGKGYDKLHIERRYLELPGDVALFRLPAIYGWPDTSRVSDYVNQFLTKGEIRINPALARWRFCRSYNKNCAFAIALALGKTGKRIYNVSEEKTYREEEWAARILAVMDWQGPVIFDEAAAPPVNADFAQDWVLDSRLIRQDLGYFEKYDVDSGLRETIARLPKVP